MTIDDIHKALIEVQERQGGAFILLAVGKPCTPATFAFGGADQTLNALLMGAIDRSKAFKNAIIAALQALELRGALNGCNGHAS